MYKQLQKEDEPFEYDSSLTTGSYKVYKSPWRGQGDFVSYEYGPYGCVVPTIGVTKGSLIGNYYIGISTDRQTLVTWRQRKNSDEVKDRTYYERVNPDVLKRDPYDFLR